MTTRNLWPFASLLGLSIAVWLAATSLARTPAFNLRLQVQTATGGATPRYQPATYNRAAYYAAVAQEWHAQTYDAALPGEPGSAERVRTRLERATRARDHAIESLRHNPSDPAVWMVVAKAEALLGAHRPALDAWQNARTLAPNSALRALERIYFLVGFMSQPEGHDLAVVEVSANTVQADLDMILRKGNIRSLAEPLSRNPYLQEILGTAAETD